MDLDVILNRRRVAILVITLFVFLLFIIFLLLLVIFLVLYSSTSPAPHNKPVHHYQHLQKNKETGGISSGFASIFEVVDDFETYEDSTSISLISPFGSTEFECKGTCTCVEDPLALPRRFSVPIVQRSLWILVAAFGSVEAYKVASKKFESECTKLFIESCGREDIHTQIDKCDEVASKHSSVDIDEMTESVGEYSCSGNCLPCFGLGPKKWRDKCTAFDCEKMCLEGEVQVSLDALRNDFKGRKGLELAKKEFRNKVLHPFCRDRSIDDTLTGKMKGWSFCTGIITGPGYPLNPSVKCRKKI